MLGNSSLVWVDLLVGTLVGAAAVVFMASVVISNGQADSPALLIIEVMVVLALTAVGGTRAALAAAQRHRHAPHQEHAPY